MKNRLIKIIAALSLVIVVIGCSNMEISKYRHDYLIAPELFQAYEDGTIDYNRYLAEVKRELLLRKIYGKIK